MMCLSSRADGRAMHDPEKRERDVGEDEEPREKRLKQHNIHDIFY